MHIHVILCVLHMHWFVHNHCRLWTKKVIRYILIGLSARKCFHVRICHEHLWSQGF